ncbi:MAG TPA: SDR family NAD(P)-dependent oxidoreductase [Telluria sp.]|jgi:short-subunit dehydrogenase
MNTNHLCKGIWLALVTAMLLAGCASGPLSHTEQQAVAGRTYVITGASSGIGRGVALQLAGLRANVVIAARRAELLDQVAAQGNAAGAKVLAVPADVAQPADVAGLAAAAVARFGRIDVWINNAGVGAIGRFEDIPIEDHARVVDVNLKGVIYGSHAALRQFRQQRQGILINIGSVESEVPQAYHASYSSTKAAVLSLGRALNEEMRLAGTPQIEVVTVMPWATDTPFFEHAANYTGHSARMPAMDEAQKAVDVIVRASLYPREEVPVGWKASAAVLGHRLTPDLSERMSANMAHKAQFEKAPATAPPTSGAVHQPMPGGQGVDGGVRARMRAEDEAREGKR